MMAKGKGTIVNIGSVAGLIASPGQTNYAASKAGIMALTRTLAVELALKVSVLILLYRFSNGRDGTADG